MKQKQTRAEKRLAAWLSKKILIGQKDGNFIQATKQQLLELLNPVSILFPKKDKDGTINGNSEVIKGNQQKSKKTSGKETATRD